MSRLRGPSAEIVPLGEAAFTVRFTGSSDATRAAVAALESAIALSAIGGRVEVVPAYESAGVLFDPLHDDAGAIERALAAAVADLATPSPCAADVRLHEIPVRYDGEDLEWVAAHTGLPVDEVVRRHLASDFRVRWLGFLPGWAYLEGLDPALEVPRLESPRVRVPPGAVAIADRFSGVYPFASPGGWRLLGRTDARLFDPAAARPALLAAGDRVRFVRQ